MLMLRVFFFFFAMFAMILFSPYAHAFRHALRHVITLPPYATFYLMRIRCYRRLLMAYAVTLISDAAYAMFLPLFA